MKHTPYFIRKQLACTLMITVLISSYNALADAQGLTFEADLQSAGWKVHTPRGKTPADFVVPTENTLEITAENAVAFLYRFVPKGEGSQTVLSWEWKVKESFSPTDLSVPGQDDRPIAIHVYFTDQNPSVMSRLSSGLAGLFGAPVSGRAITYIWGGQRPELTMLPNPFMDDGEGVLIIRRSGDQTMTEQWMSETVDLAADYNRAFGGRAPPVSVIAVSADTDDTGAKAQAVVRNLRLSQGANQE